MSKKKLIPESRFPEFANSAEWEVKTLEDILDYERPDNYIVTDTNYQNDGTPVLTANKSFVLGYTKEEFGIYNNLPAIIFDDFTVDSKFVDFPFKVKSSAIKILTPSKKDDLKFIYELISQIKFNAKEHKRHYISEYQKLKLPFPTIQEQQKIASCLSSLDEVIEAHYQKLELLKNHKKGLMQNLFPQENEKVPKLRFKEFKGEWEEKSFDQLFEIGNGRDYKHLSNGEIPVYGSGGYMLSVDDYLYDGESVCIGRKGTIDKPMFLNGKFWTVDTLFYTHSFKSCLPKYIFYVFESINWKDHNEAGGVPSLSKTNIYKIEILVPSTIEEQQKIASCLSSLDDVITAQAEKIELLKQHKKGLMQVLFPKLVE